MRYIIIFINVVIVFFISKALFKYISHEDVIFLVKIAPSGVIFIYAIGYFMIMDISPNYTKMYRLLVGSFVAIAMLIHSATINISLNGTNNWGSIALLLGIITLFSTQRIVTAVSNLWILDTL